ncbi:hypothetical protein HHI36_006728 [Cryptolaemus montrouzieri]|uniref:General transcription factor IIE subunit 1 n=1 Tax=Cryptolaemus montrouzieri TaxID=559131 RepID=A0ABD2NY12_9CUCU
MTEEKLLTEVPSSLKQLARLVVRGFYTIEDALIIDMLVRNPCMKEDDICELLKFDKKMLRARISILKNDKFIQVRLRMETGIDGKAQKVNYYFINYKSFVNVVKYKLDLMRKRLETEERDATSRASFKCPNCLKTFTDLEADQLFDCMTSEFRCTYCREIVEEDLSALPKKDSRLLLAKFNEQLDPLYILLREVEGIKLAPEVLEPEPVDISTIRGLDKRHNNLWEILVEETRVDVTIGEESNDASNTRKEQPIWMTESTVITNTDSSLDIKPEDSIISNTESMGNAKNEDIMSVLLAHEKRPSTNPVNSLKALRNDSDSSEDEMNDVKDEIGDIDTMDSEEEDDGNVPTVLFKLRTVISKQNEGNSSPLYILLREVEGIKLAPEVLEPEPVDISTIRGLDKKAQQPMGDTWSGKQTRHSGFLVEETRVDVTIGEESNDASNTRKKQPIWMTESTVITNTDSSLDIKPEDSIISNTESMGNAKNEDIMSVLLAHEKRPSTNPVNSLKALRNDSDSSEDEMNDVKDEIGDIDTMDSEEEDDGNVPTVTVGNKTYNITDINDFIIAEMTQAEKEIYVQVLFKLRTVISKQNEGNSSPLYILLREVEGIKLAPEVLEPEPVDISTIRGLDKKAQQPMGDTWSGKQTRHSGFLVEETRVDVTIGEESNDASNTRKKQPIWMTESTVITNTDSSLDIKPEDSIISNTESMGNAKNEDIMSVLLAHEKRPSTNPVNSLKALRNDSDSSEDEMNDVKDEIGDIDTMDSEEEDDGNVPTVTVGNKTYNITDINDFIIAEMTQAEKEIYVQVFQDYYSHMSY